MRQISKECTTCGGSGSVLYNSGPETTVAYKAWVQCAVCHGTGYVPTDLFVRDEGHVLMERRIDDDI